jgi:hypothetical protein
MKKKTGSSGYEIYASDSRLYNSGQEKKLTHFEKIASRTNHHLPTAIQSTMEITH